MESGLFLEIEGRESWNESSIEEETVNTEKTVFIANNRVVGSHRRTGRSESTPPFYSSGLCKALVSKWASDDS